MSCFKNTDLGSLFEKERKKERKKERDRERESTREWHPINHAQQQQHQQQLQSVSAASHLLKTCLGCLRKTFQ